MNSYIKQGHFYPYVTVLAPTVYQFIPYQIVPSKQIYFTNLSKLRYITELIPAYINTNLLLYSCVLITMVVVIGLVTYIIRTQKISNDNLIKYSMLFLLIIPFLLPEMHGRYFYPADIMSVICCFYFGNKYFVTLIIPFVSFLTYLNLNWSILFIPLPFLALLLTLVIFIVLKDVFDINLSPFKTVG